MNEAVILKWEFDSSLCTMNKNINMNFNSKSTNITRTHDFRKSYNVTHVIILTTVHAVT